MANWGLLSLFFSLSSFSCPSALLRVSSVYHDKHYAINVPIQGVGYLIRIPYDSTRSSFVSESFSPSGSNDLKVPNYKHEVNSTKLIQRYFIVTASHISDGRNLKLDNGKGNTLSAKVTYSSVANDTALIELSSKQIEFLGLEPLGTLARVHEKGNRSNLDTVILVENRNFFDCMDDIKHSITKDSFVLSPWSKIKEGIFADLPEEVTAQLIPGFLPYELKSNVAIARGMSGGPLLKKMKLSSVDSYFGDYEYENYLAVVGTVSRFNRGYGESYYKTPEAIIETLKSNKTDYKNESWNLSAGILWADLGDGLKELSWTTQPAFSALLKTPSGNGLSGMGGNGLSGMGAGGFPEMKTFFSTLDSLSLKPFFSIESKPVYGFSSEYFNQNNLILPLSTSAEAWYLFEPRKEILSSKSALIGELVMSPDLQKDANSLQSIFEAKNVVRHFGSKRGFRPEEDFLYVSPINKGQRLYSGAFIEDKVPGVFSIQRNRNQIVLRISFSEKLSLEDVARISVTGLSAEEAEITLEINKQGGVDGVPHGSIFWPFEHNGHWIDLRGLFFVELEFFPLPYWTWANTRFSSVSAEIYPLENTMLHSAFIEAARNNFYLRIVNVENSEQKVLGSFGDSNVSN